MWEGGVGGSFLISPGREEAREGGVGGSFLISPVISLSGHAHALTGAAFSDHLLGPTL